MGCAGEGSIGLIREHRTARRGPAGRCEDFLCAVYDLLVAELGVTMVTAQCMLSGRSTRSEECLQTSIFSRGARLLCPPVCLSVSVLEPATEIILLLAGRMPAIYRTTESVPRSRHVNSWLPPTMSPCKRPRVLPCCRLQSLSKVHSSSLAPNAAVVPCFVLPRAPRLRCSRCIARRPLIPSPFPPVDHGNSRRTRVMSTIKEIRHRCSRSVRK